MYNKPNVQKRIRDICFSGNSTIEAALVFPIVILTVIALLTCGIKMSERVMIESEQNKSYSERIINPLVPAETVLRVLWLGVETDIPDEN